MLEMKGTYTDGGIYNNSPSFNFENMFEYSGTVYTSALNKTSNVLV